MRTDEDGTITLTMGDGHTPERSSTTAERNDAETSNETTTLFLGYDEGRQQTQHGNGSTDTTNSEETSNDNTNETDDDEKKGLGGTSL